MTSRIPPTDRGDTEQVDPQQNEQLTRHIQGSSQSPLIQSSGSDAFRMSSVARALPMDASEEYMRQNRYAHMNATASMGPVSPSYITPNMQQAYQAYPPGPAHPSSAIQYQPYMDQSGMGMPHYSPMQAQFPNQLMYGAPQTASQYGAYPSGYVPQGSVQAHLYQGPQRSYAGQEYIQRGHPNSPMAPQPGAPQVYGGMPSSRQTLLSAPRGPPRKPKQSGHALWVGNLPPGTQVNDLKDHFSQEATKDIESVFLISKSNCAFVNYKTEPACVAAMTRFHDSRFQGVRLVCRLRKGPGSVSSPTLPSSAPGGATSLQPGAMQSQLAVDAITQNRESSAKASEAASIAEQTVNDKYFIVKSLTIEDLELSVRNGVWATQGHNEDALNKAYAAVENVFLIFSANKSGEYFGYARMDSSIDDETAKTLEWKRSDSSRNLETNVDPELPKSIPTPATEFAPKGRIIDDSARGTIFWEADSDEDDQTESKADAEPTIDGIVASAEDAESSEDETEASTSKTNADADAAGTGDASHQTFGRPFRVTWISLTKLPFYRTRGLRNPWNANREVKIARDGTELETTVGRKLVAMFYRNLSSPQMQMPVQMQQGQQAFMNQLPPQMGYGMGQMPPGRY